MTQLDTLSEPEQSIDETTRAAVVAFVKARHPDLIAEDSVELAYIEALKAAHAQISGNIALLAQQNMPEAARKLRVGLRRLRAILLLFRKVNQTEATKNLANEARLLGQHISPLRDLQALQELIEVQHEKTPNPGFPVLLKTLANKEQACYAALLKGVLSDNAVGFLTLLDQYIAERQWRIEGDKVQIRNLSAACKPFVTQILEKRWQKIQHQANDLESMDVDKLHMMRRKLKKVRYAADMFRSLFDNPTRKAFNGRIKPLQAAFGALNDQALTGRLMDYAHTKVAAHAAGYLQGYADGGFISARADIVAQWQKLSAERPYWQ